MRSSQEFPLENAKLQVHEISASAGDGKEERIV
jgi:hypothetical protein